MQKITIEPVTRIEGHAKVTIQPDGKGRSKKPSFMMMNGGFRKICGRPSFF